MIVKKVLNNNLLMVTDEDGREQVVMGPGLRFLNQVGKPLNEDQVQKIFILKDQESATRQMRLLEETPPKWIQAVEHMVETANREMGGKLHDQLFFTLLDHISFAMERMEKNIILQNRLLGEMKAFYPKEYTVALKAVDYLNKTLSVEFPKEEAGNIAFHLVNAQTEDQNMEDTMLAVQMLKDIFTIVQYHFRIEIDRDSLDYSRFTIHLQFFIRRLLDDKMLSSDENVIFRQLASEYREEMACALKIADYVQKAAYKTIPEEEILYLMIHIVRIVRADRGK